MLVISRRKGERLMIGDDIEIVVIDVSPSQVRLAIRAPASVPVLRYELLDRGEPAEPPASATVTRK
jgi:carbon storage regulator